MLSGDTHCLMHRTNLWSFHSRQVVKALPIILADGFRASSINRHYSSALSKHFSNMSTLSIKLTFNIVFSTMDDNTKFFNYSRRRHPISTSTEVKGRDFFRVLTFSITFKKNRFRENREQKTLLELSYSLQTVVITS